MNPILKKVAVGVVGAAVVAGGGIGVKKVQENQQQQSAVKSCLSTLEYAHEQADKLIEIFQPLTYYVNNVIETNGQSAPYVGPKLHELRAQLQQVAPSYEPVPAMIASDCTDNPFNVMDNPEVAERVGVWGEKLAYTNRLENQYRAGEVKLNQMIQREQRAAQRRRARQSCLASGLPWILC